MLTSLYIKNYALIDELNVKFNNGLTIITGETGAGKSILLGGLALVLGKRADLSQVKNTDEKCVIETVFNIVKYNLEPLFKRLGLDYESQTIIRREILPSGKSRAFINDSPVTLENLVALSGYLIDIHSQHQTQQLTEDDYQFQVIDALAKNDTNLKVFSKQLKSYKHLKIKLKALQNSKAELIKDYDYNLFLLNELESLKLESIDLNDLENKHEALVNIEVITEKISLAKAVFSAENIGVTDQLNTVKQEFSRISNFGKSYTNIKERIVSVGIELEDILEELDQLESNLVSDPGELLILSSQLQHINNLLQKHAVLEIQDLIAIRNTLKAKVNDTETLDEGINLVVHEIEKSNQELEVQAKIIHNNRKEILPIFVAKLEAILSDLGMPNAKFKIELKPLEDYVSNGKDNLEFLFMANKGSNFNALKKAASGGELSRIMLAIKSILADYVQLPSIMFDEIDTGVSGEISNKMADIMKQMSQKMQVFTITHLPQIAAKGSSHFKVYKEDINDVTHTQLRLLENEERIKEIAQMLSGKEVSNSALAHAKQLLN